MWQVFRVKNNLIHTNLVQKRVQRVKTSEQLLLEKDFTDSLRILTL